MSEYDTEPVPGLPQHLPEGERLIWQGSPDAKGVARRVLHTNAVAGYFAALALVPFVSKAIYGGTLMDAALTAFRVSLAGAAGFAILTVLATLIARTTIYSITSKRVVMRYGVAFPITLNIPFNEISGVDCKPYADGSADLALTTSGPLRMSYLHLWPHARSWRFENAAPTLRVVASGSTVARTLIDAMVAAGVQGSTSRVRPANQPAQAQSSAPDLASAAV